MIKKTEDVWRTGTARTTEWYDAWQRQIDHSKDIGVGSVTACAYYIRPQCTLLLAPLYPFSTCVELD